MIQLTPKKQESLKKIGIVSAIAVLFAVELGYQVWKYIKERKQEEEEIGDYYET